MLPLDRECGTCYACCVFLDIEELKKKGGRPCKHLHHRDVTKRCAIYDKRPHACSDYHCMWMTGCFTDDMRPDHCGLLGTIYNDPENPGQYLVTINVTNSGKCGTMEKGPLADMLHWILTKLESRLTRINLVNRRTGAVVEFSNGEIWQAKLLKGSKLEELQFLRQKVVGTYYTAEKVSDLPLEKRLNDRSVILQ